MDDGGDEFFPYDSLSGTFSENKINLIKKSNKGGWGITRFHNFICESIGYLGNVDNGKVMGLAAYGNVIPSLYKELSKFLIIDNDGFSAFCKLRRDTISKYNLAKLKLDAFQQYKILHSPNPPKDLYDLTKFYSNADVAATGQKIVEEITLKIIKNILKKTKSTNLVCSGGFFQNISLNRRLLELNLKNVFIPSAPNDAGLSLGAALYVKMKNKKNKRPKKHLTPFLGLNFDNNYVEEILKEYNLKYKKIKKPWKECAKLLTKGNVVGWFQGKSELGPRSLGNRSVLADPRKSINKARVNQLLKKRDWFMPYAPAILENKMKFFFKKNYKTPYMSFALKIEKNAKFIPAAVHVDNTCRPQTVNKKINFKFFNVINEFYKITGVPAVLNTSFNRHGIATIATPRQAIEHLINRCVDILIIEDFIAFPNKKAKKNYKSLLSEKYYLFIENLSHMLLFLKNHQKNFKKVLSNAKDFNEKFNIKFLNKDNIKIENKIFTLDNIQKDNLVNKFKNIYKLIVNKK